MNTLAERLQHVRDRAVLTQVELAEASGVPVITISRIENGHSTPRQSTVRALAKALDVSPQWLIFGEEKRPSPEG